MNITEEQLSFLKTNNIPLSKIFDATNQKREIYRNAMKDLEKLIAINTTPCSRYGHTIRTRSGHCCQCNTASIAYLKRHYSNGYVYIVGSQNKKVLKVGSTNNIDNRVNSLNFQNYASINDWKLIFYYKCYDMGLIETNAHNKLKKFQVERTYIKNGRTQIAYEIFDCNYDTCKNALSNVTKDNLIIEKYEDDILSQKYYFNKNNKVFKSNLNIKSKKKEINQSNLIKANKTYIKKDLLNAKLIKKNESVKENLNIVPELNKKDNINLYKNENNINVFKKISVLLIFISLCASIIFFFIFIAKFPLNLIFLIFSIFFTYLMGYYE